MVEGDEGTRSTASFGRSVVCKFEELVQDVGSLDRFSGALGW